MLEIERQRRRFTFEEYLWLEERSETKNEYIDGEIFAMTGGSLNHNRIVGNLFRELSLALEGGSCEVFQSDVRLFVKRARLFTYPDLVVVCGQIPLLEGRTDTITDARLLIEVLSPSTESYDRQAKFQMYRDLASLEEYVLVAQDQVRVERNQRKKRGQWVWTELLSLQDQLELRSVSLSIPLQAVYRAVQWAEIKPRGN